MSEGNDKNSNIKKFVEVGRLVTDKMVDNRDVFGVITDIQDSKIVIVQYPSKQRKLCALRGLYLLDTVIPIKKKMTIKEVNTVIESENVVAKYEESEFYKNCLEIKRYKNLSDFERYKVDLKKEEPMININEESDLEEET
ncbi:ribosomal protein L14 [Hamiltosporidium tvaerminnensis]|uniref:Ribosomal protein L14 n=1 Tax=Hamiltosporidium tvaerminnensis TaxID=1176355 RepID=A0A4Q9KUM6_9MICR|nr:ribosomal protein L14 [Hamiltosporidium tvaerminnensis]